ncbi:DUF924 family protein [Aestuariirhabdus sp. LZHN29]|uniref:DUF924 family protein n=1 Tax=Aestuariirhabdus sp. LZHN29 TaxID=3417462 RepID=UPI003CECFA26
MTDHPDVHSVLQFWFAELEGQPASGQALWWGKSDAVDRFVSERFGGLLTNLSAKSPALLENSPQGRLATILCFDQFPRHIYRGRERSFAWDRRARALVRQGLDAGDDRKLGAMQSVFFYMPLMHSEDLPHQEQGVALFEALALRTRGEERKQVEASVRSAHQHREIIIRFGRFPHRNRALGRQSSDEELEFLTQPGSSF